VHKYLPYANNHVHAHMVLINAISLNAVYMPAHDDANYCVFELGLHYKYFAYDAKCKYTWITYVLLCY